MADYLTDLDLNSDSDVYTDDANDLALVSGRSNLEQSIEISAGDAIEEFVGGNIDGTTIALLEERLKKALNNDPQVNSVDSVELTEFDRRTNTVSIDVSVTEDKDFTLEVGS